MLGENIYHIAGYELDTDITSRQLEFSFIYNEQTFVHNLSFLKISSMREEEKALKQKLSDVEKVKKQLQSDLANRDRTIQQLRVVR